MKNILAVFCIVFASGSLHSQTQQGTWEFSLSGNAGSVSTSSQYSGPYSSSSSESEAEGYVLLALRPGLYVVDGLALEPEILWTAVEHEKPCFSLSGNLAYNFAIPESRTTPFLLVGYGTGNAIPINNTLLFRSSYKLDISLVNLGAGLKIFLAEQAALRLEYRYQKYTEEGEYRSSMHKFHNVFFGFSVFVP